MERIAFFAGAPFCTQRKIIELPVELPTKTRPDGEAEKKSQRLLGNLQEGHEIVVFGGHKSFKHQSNTCPNKAADDKLLLRACWEALDVHFWFIFGPKVSPKTVQK